MRALEPAKATSSKSVSDEANCSSPKCKNGNYITKKNEKERSEYLRSVFNIPYGIDGQCSGKNIHCCKRIIISPKCSDYKGENNRSIESHS